VAIHYGKGLMGGAVVVALLALLIHWIGIDTIQRYRDDLLFYLQAHLMLVVASMLAALIVGIPAGIFLSRPGMVGRAERFMQVFNIGNTVPPLAFLIGANSLGSLIFPGIALNNQPQLLLGAACTALLALLLDGLVTLASRLWLERGLRPS
jgi:ABC-type proline/glycine betaine transport system permease subunit